VIPKIKGEYLMVACKFFAGVAMIATALGLESHTRLLAVENADKPSSGLSMAQFEKLHKELQPPADELWRSIPWHVSILEGRTLAAKARKPISVWVASGEPLGCG
jgi:hypothetical protein